MKKWIAILLAAMLLTVSACAEMATGGWTFIDAFDGQDEYRYEKAVDALDAAAESYDGVQLTMVEPLATQTVAGINYFSLVQTGMLTEDGTTNDNWALVNVYEDTEGNASITRLTQIGSVNPNGEAVEGGWTFNPEIESDVFDQINAALEANEDGKKFFGFILLNGQVVAGMNYEVLAKYTVFEEQEDEMADPVVKGAGIGIATIYVDLEGNSSMTAWEEIVPSAAE